MPGKPELIYDGTCGFCRYWVVRWGHLTQERIKYVPAKCRPDSVELVELDGKRHNGAEAVLRTLAYVPKLRVFLWIYKNIPSLSRLTNWAYRQVAARRESLSSLIHQPEK